MLREILTFEKASRRGFRHDFHFFEPRVSFLRMTRSTQTNFFFRFLRNLLSLSQLQSFSEARDFQRTLLSGDKKAEGELSHLQPLHSPLPAVFRAGC